MDWAFWIIASVILAVGAGVATLVWWRVGDQWADAEHKKFGPRREDPDAASPTVIEPFESPRERDD